MSEAPPRWIWDKDLQDATKALDARLHRACVLYSFFAISGFIWDLLWGIKNTWVFFPPQPGWPRHVKDVGEVIFPEQTGGAVQLSCIDFVFNYVRPGPVMHQDIRLLQQANPDLYERIRSGTDEFQLSKAREAGFLEPDEIDKVLALRAVRDFCCHFNPYSATIMRYKEALERLRIRPAESISDFSNVAPSTLDITRSLLERWRERKTQLCMRCHGEHKISYLKTGRVFRGDWTIDETGGGFSEETVQDGQTPQLGQVYACRVRVCSNRMCNRFEINAPPTSKRWNICQLCRCGSAKDVTVTTSRGTDTRVNICRSVGCDWYTLAS
jgi:hypothetical protein